MLFLRYAMSFFMLTSVPIATIGIVFEGGLRYGLILAFLLIISLILVYADKIFLVTLRAREVVEEEAEEIYSIVNSISYRFSEKKPRIYVYSGFAHRAFSLESRNEWTLLFDREILNQANYDQVESLIMFLYELKTSKESWLMTKFLGFVSAMILLVDKVSYLISFKKPNAFRVIRALLSFFLKPIFGFLTWLHFSSKKYKVSKPIEPILFKAKDLASEMTYSSFLFYQFNSDIKIDRLMTLYLESLPIFEKCKTS